MHNEIYGAVMVVLCFTACWFGIVATILNAWSIPNLIIVLGILIAACVFLFLDKLQP